MNESTKKGYRIKHYYQSFYGGIECVSLEEEDVELTKMLIQGGESDPNIIAMLRNSGHLLSTAEMILKVAKFGVKTYEQCLFTQN